MSNKTNTRNTRRTSDLKRILVPTDFSSTATEALRYAVPLAQQTGAKITLLHVFDWPLVPAKWGTTMKEEAKLKKSITASLDQLAKENVPDELIEKTLVRIGRDYRDITEAARGLRMDLIVVATHGHTGIKRALLGSTAERIVRHAPCPVLTVRKVEGSKAPKTKAPSLATIINRILVPVDFSKGSKASIEFATSLARTMQAQLALLHVVAPLPVRLSRFRTEMKQYDVETQLDARKQLEALAARVPDDIKTEVLLRQDIPHQGITKAARAWRSDLIVLPTRGLTGLKHILVGSTAEAVVRYAPCPVLTLGQA